MDYIRRTKLYKIVHPLYSSAKKVNILFNKNFRNMRHDKQDKRILLLLSPDHSNIGDHMIELAEEKFLYDFLPNNLQKKIYEFTYSDWKVLKDKITKNVRDDDLILIHGGGFIGDFYPELEAELMDILDKFKRNPIIVLPQTIYFDKSTGDDRGLEELKERINECEDFTLFTRDKKSYELAIKSLNVSDNNCVLVPDIVTYFNFSNANIERKNIIMSIMRDDKEGVCDKSRLSFLNDKEFEEYDLVSTDMHNLNNNGISIKKRKDIVFRKLKDFSEASLVLTDRLHGMLFAAITGTPCIAFDNKSKKVSGQYEWIKYLPYIKQMNIDQLSKDDVIDALNEKNKVNEYTNEPLKKYYVKIAEKIKGKL